MAGYNQGMFRILALLQLTRAALAFTAIADAWAVLLLRSPGEPPPERWLIILQMLVMAVVSFGLYGFGMALNDLLDARRDRIFAPRRPIPSGRIKPRRALIIALLLLMAAFLASAFLTRVSVWTRSGPIHTRDIIPFSFFFTLATAALIVFYDATSKYLGGLGLVTLGAIRALHCLIGNPRTPLLFLSMILLTHVIVISTISYRLENKRPRLNKGDILTVVLGILIGNGVMLWYIVTRRYNGVVVWDVMWTRQWLTMLIGPAVAAAVYWLWAASLFFSPL